MKKSLLYWFGFLLILLVMSFFATSCKSGAPIATVHEKTTEKQTDNKISTDVTVKNLAIVDSLKLLIEEIRTGNKPCDSLANIQLQKMLSKLYATKNSGDNKLGFYYDNLTKQLIAFGKVAESTNQHKTDTIYKETVSVQEKIKETPVKYVPKWIQYLAIFGFIIVVLIIAFFSYKLISILNPKLP